MNTSIYCFSATGNSLMTAKLLTDGIDNCKLIPVATYRGHHGHVAEKLNQLLEIQGLHYLFL